MRRAIRNQVTPDLAFRSFNRVVIVAHRWLHDLGQLRVYWSIGKLFQSLTDDSTRLSHFFQSHQVTIISVTVLTERDVKIHVGVSSIRARLPHVPRDSRTA